MEQPLTTEQKEQIENLLEDKIGRSFNDGIHAQILREVDIRCYEHEDDSVLEGYGVIVNVIVEGARLKADKLPYDIMSVEQADISGYRDGFKVHLSGVVNEVVN